MLSLSSFSGSHVGNRYYGPLFALTATNLKDGHGLPDGTADKANPWALARLPVSLTVYIRHGDVTERGGSLVTAARPSATSRPTILLNGKSTVEIYLDRI